VSARRPGALVISLDFELHWGVRDRLSLERYGNNLHGERHAVPLLLSAFSDFGIQATWATVGFLFCANKNELLGCCPETLPTYSKSALSPYPTLASLGRDEQSDPLHFGASLVDRIAAVPGQELASHTFSHYYCTEPGQTREQFEADMRAAQAAANLRGVELHSLVFPRNQFNPQYLGLLAELGFSAYRGNPRAWVYRSGNPEREAPLKRGLRLADAYLALFGHDAQAWPTADEETGLVNVSGARFLRPYSVRLAALENIRLYRVLDAMSYAAQQGLLYHLWWHPHNFGAQVEQNFSVLRRILEHYRNLAEREGMLSLNMNAVARRVRSEA
jgi:peptidoglycan/xylan/chitin deacetylase (PgdA/CDA1 family)